MSLHLLSHAVIALDKYNIPIKKKFVGHAQVAHACNPSCLEVEIRRIPVRSHHRVGGGRVEIARLHLNQ
jgi:hypothetical protein